MAKRKSLTNETSGMSFGELFQKKMKEIVNVDALPEQLSIPTGNDLFDKIIGGGLLTGTFNMFTGPALSGKSTFVINIMSNFLKMFPNGYVIYFDTEQATTDDRIRMLGVPFDEAKKENRIFKLSYGCTVEEVFQSIQNFIELKEKFAIEKDDPSERTVPSLIVWDSVDMSPTIKELEVDSSEKATGQKAKQIGFFMRKYTRDFRKYNILFITVNHITKKLSMMGPYEPYDGAMASLGSFRLSGGKSIQYGPSTLCFLRGMENTKKRREILEKYGIESGSIVEASTMKCKRFSCNITVELIFDSIYGFDNFITKVHNMIMSEWIRPNGRSYSFPDDEEKYKLEDFRNLYMNDETFKNKFDKSWNDYIENRYSYYTNTLNRLNEKYPNMDTDGLTNNINMGTMNEMINDTFTREEGEGDIDPSFAREADFSNEMGESEE